MNNVVKKPLNTLCRCLLPGCFSLLLPLSSAPASAATTDKLFSLSLKQLSAIPIETATLITSSLDRTPAAVTVITQAQIKQTPARNLMDLLEVYVPGLMVISNFSSGPLLRIRGLGERHYHTLLLVNGKPVNQKTHQGAMVELRHWDMADIDRVEMVRGPGSVTHGPGAISAVINIITKKANKENGFKLAVGYNATYHSKGVKLAYGKKIADSRLFFHGSYTQTRGLTDYPVFQTLANNGQMGYKGTDAFTGTDGFPLQAYYGDFEQRPQIKLYLDIDIDQQWRFWARYGNSGQTNAATQRIIQDQMQDWRVFENRYYIASLENHFTINERLKVKSILSYDSEDHLEIMAKQTALSNTHELNRRYAFSENEIYFKTSAEYTPSASLSFALAFEFSHDYLAAPWGDPDSSFITRTGGKVFITEDSPYFGDGSGGTVKANKVAEFTHGWSTNTYSLAGELKYRFTPALTAMVSARADKNDQSDNMYSPRIALI